MNIHKGAISKKFILPPFSVLDTRNSDWLERRRWWKSFGIEAELGRDVGTYETKQIQSYGGKKATMDTSSIFDPVLCELIYSWFCPNGGTILDPFAGGSVRGLVAGYLGYDYTGMDLNEEQVEANVKNISTVTQEPEKLPRWIIGDSEKIDEVIKTKHDMIFSCPPYFDLEIYTNKTNDLSNMSYSAFCGIYESIIKKCGTLLKDNRFACFVVSEIRDKDGFYRGLVPETISAFEKAGMNFYNEAILVNSIGTLPYRVGKQFTSSRKMGRHHQNVLIFYKGDPKFMSELQIEDVFDKGEQASLW